MFIAFTHLCRRGKASTVVNMLGKQTFLTKAVIRSRHSYSHGTPLRFSHDNALIRSVTWNIKFIVNGAMHCQKIISIINDNYT